MKWPESPCASCTQTPCCSHLPLHSFIMENAEDWKKAEKLLDFPGIRLGLRSDGEFRVYLNRTCPNQKKDKRCAIHDTPFQSHICMNYSPHTCWYKRAFSDQSSNLLILLNKERLTALGKLIIWKKGGEVDKVAPWDLLCKSVNHIKLINEPPYIKKTNPIEQYDYLLVPPGRPEKSEHWDLVRFRLSFTGVYLSLSVNKSDPSAFLVAANNSIDGGIITEEMRGWDPFLTNHSPVNSELIDIKKLNILEKLI